MKTAAGRRLAARLHSLRGFLSSRPRGAKGSLMSTIHQQTTNWSTNSSPCTKAAKERAAAKRQVLEQFLYAICREGVTRERPTRRIAALRERFFDWNELRVSSTARSPRPSTSSSPDAEARGQRLIDFLQEVFETTFSFDLEGLQKKGVKQAAKQLVPLPGGQRLRRRLGGAAEPGRPRHPAG